MNKAVKWKDIKLGDEFLDGSKVTKIHETHIAESYMVKYENNKLFKKSEKFQFELSGTHLLLCDISLLTNDNKQYIVDNFSNYLIPTLYDKHVYLNETEMRSGKDINSLPYYNDVFEEKLEVIEADLSKVSETLFWLPVSLIHELSCLNEIIKCNGYRLKTDYLGHKEVFCVETDTHSYNTVGIKNKNELDKLSNKSLYNCGLIHHNSVSIRNVIFHALTHGEDLAIGLIDVKLTEFGPWKGHKNVVAVANNVKEAVEMTRMAREVMYKRNAELAKLGLNDIVDFKPQNPTENVVVAGRNLHDNDKVQIKLMSGEIKEVTVKDLEQYL